MEMRKKDWKKFVDETQKSQEVVGELSKLYIILHENVRETILKCTINLKYDPTPDCRHHLTTILDLLKRMNDPADAYLEGVDGNILSKFEEQIHDLSQQVQKLLMTYNNSTGIDVKQLQRIKRGKQKQEYGLKDQLRRSEQRRLRSRSGKKRSQFEIMQIAQEVQPTSELIDKFSAYKVQFKAKREKLLKQMQGHIQKKSNQIIFTNKYSGSNLEDYFSLRKQLFDLQIADQYTQKIVRQYDSKPIKKDTENTKQIWQNKLFGEFKIKTKYMKQHVKENILNTLVDVKMKLLEEYHSSNMKRLRDQNPDTLIKLLGEKKEIVKNKGVSVKKPTSKNSSSASTLHQLPHSPLQQTNRPFRQASLTRYPMAHKTCRPLVYGTGWTHQKQDTFRQTMTTRFHQGKVPTTNFN